MGLRIVKSFDDPQIEKLKITGIRKTTDRQPTLMNMTYTHVIGTLEHNTSKARQRALRLLESHRSENESVLLGRYFMHIERAVSQ